MSRFLRPYLGKGPDSYINTYRACGQADIKDAWVLRACLLSCGEGLVVKTKLEVARHNLSAMLVGIGRVVAVV